MNEPFPGQFVARFAEAAPAKPVRGQDAKVAALEARHSANT